MGCPGPGLSDWEAFLTLTHGEPSNFPILGENPHSGTLNDSWKNHGSPTAGAGCVFMKGELGNQFLCISHLVGNLSCMDI